MNPFTEIFRIGKSLEMKPTTRLPSTCLNGYTVSFWGDDKVLELDRGMVAQHCVLNLTELYFLKVLKW